MLNPHGCLPLSTKSCRHQLPSAWSKDVVMGADADDKGLRRSERTSRPALRQAYLVDLPDSDEDEEQEATTPDEAPKVCSGL